MSQKQVYDEKIHDLKSKIVEPGTFSYKLSVATLDVTKGPGNVNVNAYPHYHVIEVGSPKDPGYGPEQRGASAVFNLPADIKKVDATFLASNVENDDVTVTFYDSDGEELKKVKQPAGVISCESGDKTINKFEVVAVRTWAAIEVLKYFT